MRTVMPFGSWASPVTTELLTRAAVTIGHVEADGGALWWTELRPEEGGRVAVVREGVDVLPAGLSARTTVHEYGGGAACFAGGVLYFSSFEDQRLHRLDPAGEPVAITPEEDCRYADVTVSADGRWLVAVREDHRGEGEARNELVLVATDGAREPEVLWSGSDFVAAPRLSPDGRSLAWISWDHPAMPWDATTLWVADVEADGTAVALGEARVVAGGAGDVSVVQPRWVPDGSLLYASDRTGWWNLYRRGQDAPLVARDAEFAGPQWGFRASHFDILPTGDVACVWSAGGESHLGVLGADGELREIATPYTTLSSVAVVGDRIACIAASATEPSAVVLVDAASGAVEVVRRSREVPVDRAYLSVPEAIEFPTEGGRTAHAFYYAPSNPDFEGPDGERPPLLVISHGGPTGAATSSFDLTKQFWTSRGIAVVDVNYGGSAGFGRAYRDRLKGEWGVVDLQDCVSAARYLADRSDVDGDRLLIRGGSAGGYTTLCALTFTDAFAAGASYYGVSDAGALARDTHKFESRYLDGLIGPWPEAQQLYEERSPIFHTDLLSVPVIVFQGLDDKVVPPAQAEVMVSALAAKGIKHRYVAFEGEAHGFRRAENVQRAYAAELAFYGEVLGFSPA